MYTLGIDLGTTYTAAATWREGRAEIASLGTRAAAIPSVVLLRGDETFVVGETASRRGLTEPRRVAREFKRRFGDTTPLLLGGVPYSAEALMARLLRSVVDDVVQREGAAPVRICLSHPANWGPYKTDMLRQAVRLANVEQPVEYTTEPVAAAVSYAQQERVEPGATVAVYDLGGGTFDAAVLRRTHHGFEILGQPEGIERLGGIDFDAAVFAHVAAAIGGKIDELDVDDAAAIAAVARLRGECVDAKEALSSDTDVSIPVLLPNLSTEVRLTRAELEAMVRPALYDSIEAMRRALASAGVKPEDLHSVLLVGGSSRMPLVSQMIGAELGRPVAVDTHPKHAVALGAAWLAAGDAALATDSPVPTAMPAPPRTARADVPVASGPAAEGQRAGLAATAPMPAVGGTAAAAGQVRGVAAVGGTGGHTGQAGPDRVPGAKRPSARPRPSRSLVVGASALVMVLALAGAAFAILGGEKDDPAGQPAPLAPTASAAPSEATLPPDEQCTDAIKANERWVCLNAAVFDGSKLTVYGDVGVPKGKALNANRGFHMHFFGSDGTNPDPASMGSHTTAYGKYYTDDKLPSVAKLDVITVYAPAGQLLPAKVCARIAVGSHGLVKDTNGGYDTGNCVPITQR